MLNTLLLFLCIILGFISVFIIYNKRVDKQSPFINKYLIFLIYNTSIRYILHFIYSLDAALLPVHLILIVDSVILIALPCFYLYFEDLIFEEKYTKKKLLHFIIPTILTITITIANNVDQEKNTLVQKVFILIGILSALFYLAKAFVLLYKNVWFRKSDIKIVQGQNKLIRNWTLFLFCSFLFIFLFRFFIILFYYKTANYSHYLIWVSALAWCFIFLKFILTPEIQYGYGFLNQNIEKLLA